MSTLIHWFVVLSLTLIYCRSIAAGIISTFVVLLGGLVLTIFVLAVKDWLNESSLAAAPADKE